MGITYRDALTHIPMVRCTETKHSTTHLTKTNTPCRPQSPSSTRGTPHQYTHPKLCLFDGRHVYSVPRSAV